MVTTPPPSIEPDTADSSVLPGMDFFAQVLDLITNSAEQNELAQAILQNQRYVRRMTAAAGALAMAAVMAMVLHPSLEVAWLDVGLGWLAWRCIRSADEIAQEVVNIAQIKDRVHFTQCLLASSSVEHLARAGLWEYLKIDHREPGAEKEMKAAILASVEQLKGALNVLPHAWAESRGSTSGS